MIVSQPGGNKVVKAVIFIKKSTYEIIIITSNCGRSSYCDAVIYYYTLRVPPSLPPPPPPPWQDNNKVLS